MGIRLNVDADTKPFSSGMSLAQGAMAGFAATITNVALRAVRDLAGGITEFITDTSKVNAITTAFDNMSGSIGLSADEMLEKLGPATRGLVSDFDLMEISNNPHSVQGTKARLDNESVRGKQSRNVTPAAPQRTALIVAAGI